MAMTIEVITDAEALKKVEANLVNEMRNMEAEVDRLKKCIGERAYLIFKIKYTGRYEQAVR